MSSPLSTLSPRNTVPVAPWPITWPRWYRILPRGDGLAMGMRCMCLSLRLGRDAVPGVADPRAACAAWFSAARRWAASSSGCRCMLVRLAAGVGDASTRDRSMPLAASETCTTTVPASCSSSSLRSFWEASVMRSPSASSYLCRNCCVQQTAVVRRGRGGVALAMCAVVGVG